LSHSEPFLTLLKTPYKLKNCMVVRLLNHIYQNGAPAMYGGHTLRSLIEAPLITREVLPETYFLLVIMAADAQARQFFTVSSIMLMWNLVNFWFSWQLLRFLRFSIVIPG
jgi:hypothetical protein